MIIVADTVVTGTIVGTTAAGLSSAASATAGASAVTAAVGANAAAGAFVTGGGFIGWSVLTVISFACPLVLVSAAAVGAAGEETNNHEGFDFHGSKDFVSGAGESSLTLFFDL